MKVRDSLDANLAAASEGMHKAASLKPAFIALPEYFSVPNSMENFISARDIHNETYRDTIVFLSEISKEIPDSYISGGTVLEEDGGKFFNTATLWKNGALIGKYKKKNPIALEIRAGVSRGSTPVVLETDYCKVGLLVCADMFDTEFVQQTVRLGAELIFLPVAAMGTHPSVKGHPLVERTASENVVFMIKVGNVSSSLRGGRSAVISPWGLVVEATDAIEDSLITVDLDILRLRDYREKLSRALPNPQQSGPFH
jgi:omega-amidase